MPVNLQDPDPASLYPVAGVTIGVAMAGVRKANGGSLTVNTGLIIQGPPIGTNTTGQEAEGPHCVSGGHH